MRQDRMPNSQPQPILSLGPARLCFSGDTDLSESLGRDGCRAGRKCLKLFRYIAMGYSGITVWMSLDSPD